MASPENRVLLLDVNALLALVWPNHAAVLARLERQHIYLETLPALPRTASVFRHLLGHQQVKDAYLLGVAEANGATLLTLDRRLVPPGTMRAHLEIVEP
ncbi:MAG TPA: hypothetical protein VGX68_07875 [Thermoanaerobaculia bacterium]|jgi:predicted nucleic acid-binding protein|nr:hypothetical protein [Thermoanaerobaculia bacterium]